MIQGIGSLDAGTVQCGRLGDRDIVGEERSVGEGWLSPTSTVQVSESLGSKMAYFQSRPTGHSGIHSPQRGAAEKPVMAAWRMPRPKTCRVSICTHERLACDVEGEDSFCLGLR